MNESTSDTNWQEHFSDMPPDTFRQFGYKIVDWIADYRENIERYPVLSQVKPGDILQALPAHPPQQPEMMENILADFEKVIVPGITHWNHPAFFAYFAITGSAPGILAEFLSAALNANAMLWRTSPAATELEDRTLDWLRQMLGLPEAFRGVIYDTASISTLVALVAARESLNLQVRQKGMSGRPELPRLRLYSSEEAHSSVEKAAIILGLGQESVRRIPTDSSFRMQGPELQRAIEDDIRTGWQPFCVVATVGTTSTTSIDPVSAIADVCVAHQLWLHVDASYGGVAAIADEMRWVLTGVDRADSLVINPHKWLFTPIDLSAFYSRRLEVVRQAFSLVPEYLQTSEDPRVRNYMDYGPQLGRRFRALKLWFVIRAFGTAGIADRLREHLRLARLFAQWVDDAPGWERIAPVPFSTVCFRAIPDGLTGEQVDALNQSVMDNVNASGQAFLSHTRLNGRFVLRLAIGNLETQLKHVELVWTLLQEAAEKARASA